jgi:hypothetical protein
VGLVIGAMGSTRVSSKTEASMRLSLRHRENREFVLSRQNKPYDT